MNNSLSEIFDTTPPATEYNPPALVVEETSADDDINLARGNLKQLMDTVSDAIREAMDVAISSESPRAFEVVTGMITAAADLNSKLIASHQIQQKMKQDAGTLAPPTNVTNNNVVFAGTPAELAKLLKGEKK